MMIKRLLIKGKKTDFYAYDWPFKESIMGDEKLLKIANDSNLYRKHYSELSYEDLKKLNMFWYNMPPTCLHFDSSFVNSCVKYLTKRLHKQDLFIVELGGAQGELAYEILGNFPRSKWRNYDIIPFWRVRDLSRFDYEQIVLAKQFWLEKINFEGCDLFIMSDVIEHFTDEEAIKILDIIRKFKAKSIIIKSPLSPEGQTWDDYFGSHLLKMGISQLKTVLSDEYRIEREYFDSHFWVRK